MSPDEFTRFVASEIAKWTPIAKSVAEAPSRSVGHLAAHDTSRYSLRSAASESCQEARYGVRQTGMQLMTPRAPGW